MRIDAYNNQYRKYVNFIKKYRKASNAATGSEVDSNANVETKNIATCHGELCKREKIGYNRLMMIDKLTEMYDADLAEEYIRQLESHEIYKHDETSIYPYCVSITMYPFLFGGLKNMGGISEAPTNLDSFCGSFINLVFAVAAQFAGAVSTPEFLMYMDYFIRKDYGDDYWDKADENISASVVIRKRTMKQLIHDKYQQIIYSINQPAAARDYQSVFWNIAYFDEPYFNGMFENFVFPDGSVPNWETVSKLQEDFMEWFNEERTKAFLTFPVETVNLLNDGKEYVDIYWADKAAEMYAKGHSFFTYTSNSVDSLASCCFDGKEMCLTRSSAGVQLMSFADLYNGKHTETKRNMRIFHDGNWVGGKVIRLPKGDQQMYEVTTANKKKMVVTGNHIFPTIRGDVRADDLRVGDKIQAINRQLETYPEKDAGLTYEEGFLIGMYLGDGSIEHRKETFTPTINLSLNEEKWVAAKDILRSVHQKYDAESPFKVGEVYNNVCPIRITSWPINNFIREYVRGNYCHEKELNLDCLTQSADFRRGILDGLYTTDGGNSNRIYTTSEKLAEQLEVLITSLGMNSVIDISDRTDEPVVIRGEVYKRNFPLHCIRWYDPGHKRSMGGIYEVRRGQTFFDVVSVRPVETEDEWVYCFEMENQLEPYFTLPNGIMTHNCRLRNEMQDNAFSYTLGAGGVSTGSKGVMTININRLVQNAVRDGRDISEAVTEQVGKIHKYLLAFNEIIKDNLDAGLLGVYNAGYISMDKQYLTIGINGFVEGAEFLGIDISPNDEYFKYGEMILKPIYDANRAAKSDGIMFNTEFVPKVCGHKAA